MKARVWLFGFGMLLALSVAVIALEACGGAQSAKFTVAQKSGELPAGQTWEGVYYNPVYGYLHVVGKEGNLVGRWKRTDSSHWGELNGTADGNVFRFTWTEHKIGAVGPSADAHGTGVFVYKVGENSIGELDGQYAVQDSDAVGDWHCIKQLNVKPDLNSINGDNPAAAAPPDQWQ
ncbi:MAG: hypothetical protein ABSC94_21710 [Polyangiaceae bacterium]|jgi:hypothetical protein